MVESQDQIANVLVGQPAHPLPIVTLANWVTYDVPDNLTVIGSLARGFDFSSIRIATYPDLLLHQFRHAQALG